VRARHGVPEGSVLFAVCGGLTPEKRIAPVLEAFAVLLRYQPGARLVLAGHPSSHYDLAADIRRFRLQEAVILTGYIDSDETYTEYLRACDVSINLRWPTARETSGPWLRALAAGRPTITMDLSHMADVPALDPRTWLPVHAARGLTDPPAPVTVGIDITDEQHSLRLALRRLATDADLRERLGRAAARYWEREHSVEGMVEDYRRVIALAITRPIPLPALPAHLLADGRRRLHELLGPFGFAADPWGRI
jgi:glycosyltransferase involved in cell wall biosynthesis